MKLAQYIKTLKHSVRPRTVGFLIKENNVLLGLKKKGFGKGYYLGIGGKVEAGESIKHAAKREIQEEIGVTVTNLKKVAILTFYFPHITDESWNQEVHVFFVNSWQGAPQESEEIKPEWFNIQKVPLDTMWDDARYWLPQVLDGKTARGSYMFNKDLTVVEFTS